MGRITTTDEDLSVVFDEARTHSQTHGTGSMNGIEIVWDVIPLPA